MPTNDQPDWVSPTAQVQRVLGSVTAAAGLSNSASFPVPTEAQVIGLMASNAGGNLTPSLMSISGDQSNVLLESYSPVALGLHLTQRPLTETSMTLAVTAPAGGPSKVTLLSFTSHPVVSVGTLVDRLLNVRISAGSLFITDSLGVIVDVTAGASGKRRLDVYESDPEPWQSPASSFGSGAAGVALGAGGSSTLIAGVFAQTITLNRIKRLANASNSVVVWEDTGSVKTVWTDTQTPGGSDGIECGGMALPSGAGLQIRNINAVATGTIWATVHYTQK